MGECERAYGLDFVKTVATLAIVLHHYQQIHYAYFEHGINFYYGRFDWSFMVELFFSMSGYVMYAYVERIQNGLEFGRFFIKRYLRFFPLMLISVICGVLVISISETRYGLYWNCRMDSASIIAAALGLHATTRNTYVNNPLWYIGVLLVCYIVMYCLVRVANRLQIACHILFLIMTGIGVYIYCRGFDLYLVNTRTGRGFIAFFVGLNIAGFFQKHKRVLILTVLSWIIVLGYPILIVLVNPVTASINATVQYLIFALLYTPAVVIAFTGEKVTRFFCNNKWIAASDISYNVYVCHVVLFVVAALFYFIIGWGPDFENPVTACVMLVYVYLMGSFSFLFLDKPLQNIVKRLYLSNKSISKFH